MDRLFSSQNETLLQEFDFGYPVVNIGSHPDNDIVLPGKSALAFHATLHMRDGQFHLIALGGASSIRLNGKPLSDSPTVIQENQQIEIGNYMLAFRQNGSPESIHVSLAASSFSAASNPTVSIPQGENPILVNAPVESAEIDVEQTASYELEIINGGPIVAAFFVTLSGVPEEWVEISSRMVNLNEGQRARVRIDITPPRNPSSTAGKHPLQVQVQSPNYGGHSVQKTLTLVIRPYYEFTIGALAPKDQRISWGKRTGKTQLPIANHSNSVADFNITAVDDENGCVFDLQVNDEATLTRQATIGVPAGNTYNLPIQITPHKRRLFAFSSKRYPYTTTVQSPQGSTQMTSGSVSAVPLFGWWSIVLTLLLVGFGLFLLLQPNIYNFQVAAGKDIIEQGDTTRLEWSVSPFATNVSISGIDQAINRGQTSLTLAPNASGTYEIVAGNWLSGLLRMDQRRSITVLVVPPTPRINVFDVGETNLARGKPVMVRWSVTRAEQAFLTIDEVVYELPKEEFSGEREVILDKDSLVTIEARNASGSELRSYFVNVVEPEITVRAFTVWVRPQSNAFVDPPRGGNKTFRVLNIPDPNFPQKYVELLPDRNSDTGYRAEFYQPDRELAKGEQVMIEWDIEGTDSGKIQIAPFTEALPARGSQPFFPQESMNFVMTAKSGELEELFMLPVKVFDGTPPTAPKIEFFRASPVSAVGPSDVQFAWSVSGNWTRVQLSTEGTVVADYVNPQGFRSVRVGKSTTYILTAWNGNLSSAAPVEITINPTLIAVGIGIKSVYVPGGSTDLMVGNKAAVTIEFFKDPANPTSGPPTPEPLGIVLISDGISTCQISLPALTCDLTFTTPGSPKEIRATYYGNAVYTQATSEAFKGINVTSAQVKLDAQYFFLEKPANTKGAQIGNLANTPLELDKGLYLVVNVQPVNTTLVDDKKGKIIVYLCEQNPGPALGACDTTPLGIKTVDVPVNTTTGIAEIAIANFPAAGTRVLKIEYRHDAYAIDTTSINQFNVQIKGLDIQLSLSACQDPVGLTNCNVGASDITRGELLFDLVNFSTGTMLSTTLPSPSVSDFTFHHLNNTTKINWNCAIVEQNATYKLECKNINFGSYGNKSVTYSFTGSTVYNLLPGSNPFTLNISRSTSVQIDGSKLVGARVGQPFLFTEIGGTANQVVKLFDASTNPPSQTLLATGNILISAPTGPEGLFGKTSSSPGCNITNSGKTVEIVSRTARCEVFFNKVVSNMNLQANYEGDINHAPSSTNAQVTITRQNNIDTRWQANEGSGYVDWGLTSWKPDELLPIRVILRDSSASPVPPYASESLIGRKLRVNLITHANPDNGTCILSPAFNITEITPGEEYDISALLINGDAVADFQTKCTKEGMDVSFAVSFPSDEQSNLAFKPSPPTILNRRLFFADRGSVNMQINLVRKADSDESILANPDRVKKLFVGETYDVKVKVGIIWADYFLGNPGSPGNLADAQNYYLTRDVVIRLPAQLHNQVDTTQPNACPYSSIANTINVPMTGFSYRAGWGDNGTSGYSDIEVSNWDNSSITAPCTLTFKSDASLTTTTESILLTYNAPSPVYSGRYSVTRTLQLLGVGKQNVTMTFGAPVLNGSGPSPSLNFITTVQQNFPIDLAREVTGSTLPMLDTANRFNFSQPAGCSGMSANTAYTAPAISATAGITFPSPCSGPLVVQYLGNDYFNLRSRNISITVNNATSTSVNITANPTSSRYGQVVTFTAVVSPGATGNIQFRLNGTNIGSEINVNNGNSYTATYTTTAFQLPVGTPIISAVFTSTSSSFANSTGTLNYTVNKANTSTSLTSSLNPAFSGESVTFTAIVTATSPGSGIPDGQIQFKNNGVNIDSPVNLTSGQATLTLDNLTTGTHSITAEYLDSGNYNTSTSSAISQVVRIQTVNITANPTSSRYGQVVTFTAVASPGTTGKIQFRLNGTNIGAEINVNNGNSYTATYTTTAFQLPVGTPIISAVFTSTSNTFANSTGTLDYTVDEANTSTSLTSSLNPAFLGNSVTFTATVTATSPGSGTPDGQIQFKNNGVNINSPVNLTSGQATLTLANLTTGTHSITAEYLGSGNYNTSTSSAISQVVRIQTQTQLASNAIANSTVYGQTVTFTATVQAVAPGTGIPTGTIQFKNGSANLGAPITLDVVSGQASLTINDLPVGPLNITAVYIPLSGSNFSGSTSTILPHTVTPAATTVALQISPSSATYGAPVTLTATISVTAPGGGTPSGTVTFSRNGTPICANVIIASGTAPCNNITNLPVGTHTITAVYTPNTANYTGSTSTAVSITITPAATTVALQISPTPSATQGATVTLTATISVTAPGGGTPTGTVQFRNGTTVLGSITLPANGVAIFTTTTLPTGTHNNITAVYTPNTANYTGSTSTAVSITINP
jgi:hypothetical protein